MASYSGTFGGIGGSLLVSFFGAVGFALERSSESGRVKRASNTGWCQVIYFLFQPFLSQLTDHIYFWKG